MMPGPDGQRCEDCYYLVNPSKYAESADLRMLLDRNECHRSHPGNWIPVKLGDWCGEFKPKLSTSDGVSNEQKR